jgi:hypothetical protein
VGASLVTPGIVAEGSESIGRGHLHAQGVRDAADAAVNAEASLPLDMVTALERATNI